MSQSSDDCDSYTSSNHDCSSEDEGSFESNESSDFNDSDDSSEDSETSSEDENSEIIWNWSDTNPRKKLKPFNDTSNTLHQHYSQFRPIDAFMLLFTEELFELIWQQTNIYGQQNRTNWTSIDSNEIKRWIGINILMGYHKLPSYRNYWSTDTNFNVPVVSKSMTRDMFSKILNNIHLADNGKIPPKSSKRYSKTYKVDHFLQILRDNFQENYILSENISIDESMIKFKGRSSFKQYLPKKTTKRGFKVWTLADSKNGYVYNFEIYAGKDKTRTNVGLGEHVVKKLIYDLKFSYRKVFFDSYFTSPNLLEYLYNHGLYAAGTVRCNRKHMPKDFCESKDQLAHGEFEYISSNNVVLFKWMDKKLVFLLSNFHDPKYFNVIQRKEKNGIRTNVECPQSIIDYNEHMGGVDRADQRKESYLLDRKSKRFWLRIFFNFLNITLSNSFILFKERTDWNMTYLTFLSSITTALIYGNQVQKHSSPGINSNKKQNRTYGRKIQFDLVNMNEPHLPIVGAQRRCAFCSTRGNGNRSSYHCSHCNRAFCMNSKRNCFYKYHKNVL